MKKILTFNVFRALRDLPRMKEAGTDYALVEFVSPPSEPLWAIFEEDNPRHEFFCFDDVTSPWAVSTASLAGYQAPTDDDIQRLLDASDTLLEAEYVYSHCEAGISRSTAAAYILHCIDLGPGLRREVWCRGPKWSHGSFGCGNNRPVVHDVKRSKLSPRGPNGMRHGT